MQIYYSLVKKLKERITNAKICHDIQSAIPPATWGTPWVTPLPLLYEILDPEKSTKTIPTVTTVEGMFEASLTTTHLYYNLSYWMVLHQGYHEGSI